MATTYLSRNITSTNSTWTFSAWVKRTGISSTQYLIEWGTSSGNGISFSSSDKIQYYAEGSGSNPVSDMLFRDTGAWYHIVVRNNAGTLTFYVNGETITMSSGAGSALSATTMRIGDWRTGDYHFNGVMSHVHFIDGTAYAASAFGSTDSTTGEWKINTNPSVTYGSDGFFILKDGNSVTDQSGNSNNFTVSGGTLTKTEDCPSNNFNIWNMAARLNNTLYIDYGATQAYSDNASWRSLTGTLGASSGKFYYEAMPHSHDYSVHGWVSDNLVNKTTDGAFAFSQLYSYGYKTYSGVVVYNENAGGGSTSYGVNIDPGDVLGCAIDIDNSKAYWAKNGVWLNSADPVNGTNGFSIQSGQTYVPAIAIRSSGGNPTARCNFGNGYFGTTAVSSAGTNASNNGIFEYDVPTGYTALSTKGLNL